ncbi:hypothetical protein PoHVEF18_010242 [Penicillium ochrochloron]
MSEIKTIMFVPGAWHSPDCFDSVIQRLDVANYRSLKIHLPSVNPPIHYRDFGADVTHIRTQIETAIEDERQILVVVHSYGSLPTSEAIQGLDVNTRQKQGLKGGVAHLFFCCSFIIPEGQSLISAFGGNRLPWFTVSEDQLEVQPATPDKIFYNDCNDTQVKDAVASLKPHSYQTFYSPCTYAAWKQIPSTYLYCRRDAAIPISVQKMMVEGTAKGYAIKTEDLDASHSPFFSKPDDLSAAIRRAAGERC